MVNSEGISFLCECSNFSVEQLFHVNDGGPSCWMENSDHVLTEIWHQTSKWSGLLVFQKNFTLYYVSHFMPKKFFISTLAWCNISFQSLKYLNKMFWATFILFYLSWSKICTNFELIIWAWLAITKSNSSFEMQENILHNT